MNIVSVTQLLARQHHGLDAPILNVLVADTYNYSIHLLQPQARIEATQAEIRNRDGDLASAQFGDFLEKAFTSGADLVMTPEYSIPWSVLRDVISGADRGPAIGKLWVLGCESIKYSELQRFRDEISEHSTVIFEEMNPNDCRFVDPLAYVFRTTESRGDERHKLVVLVQFKTHPMADDHDFEKNRLQLGSDIYQFGSYGAGISLSSFICSDAFAVTDNIAQQVYDRSLILHIQLNPEPRHQRFLECRAKLLGFAGDNTEIICLNWARGVEFWIDDELNQWENIAGSAWYGKMREFDSSDTTLSQNHRRGLYYTRLNHHRAHALFFNFNPSVYCLTASKVARLGVPGPVGRRRGPQLDAVLNGDSDGQTWANIANSDDGFLDIVNNCGGAADQVSAVFNACPVVCERLLALCAGNADVKLDWFHPAKLDSFSIGQSELINRITFCQDSAVDATQFRVRRLSRCAQLWAILHTPEELPEVLKANANGFVLDWTNAAPHQNLLYGGGERATAMYLGEDSNETTIKRKYKNARERIRLSMDEEAADHAKLRVVLWYRDTDGMVQRCWDPPVIDRQRGESEYDIGRMS